MKDENGANLSHRIYVTVSDGQYKINIYIITD